MNNRNCKPSLRLVDGGPSPWSIKGMLRAATAPAAPAETITQKYARQDAERAAKAAAAAPAAPAPVQPAAGISGYVGNTALQAREKAAGLRYGGELEPARTPAHARGLGGEVEGPKGVDKVNSRYTDGEFVASVPMMKKVPGLRDYLNDLRTEVLAEQGMTPEEADAKAVGGKTLRASAGGGGWTPKNPSFPGGIPISEQGVDAMAAIEEQRNAQKSLAAQQGPEAARMQNEARYGKPNTAAQTPAAMAAQAAKGPGMQPMPEVSNWKNTAKTVGTGIAAGAAGAGAAHLARSIGDPASAPSGSYTPPEASLQIPTDGYPTAPAAQPHNWFKDTDVGRNVGNTLNALSMIPGTSVLSNSLRLGTGTARAASQAERLVLPAIAGAAADVRAGMPAPATAPAPAPAPAPTYSGAQGPMGPQINPDAPSLRGRPGADVAGAPGVSKFVENGRTLYSNVAGDNAYMMDKKLVGIVPGMSQGLINQTLTNPDGSRWSANDNAIMAANLRDGIDPYRGTSRQKGEDEAAQLKGMRELAFSKPGTPGRRSATKMFAEQQQQQTLRQGQDLKYKGDTYNADMTAATAQLKARADATKDQRDFAVSRYDKGLEQGAKMDEQGRAAFKNKFDTLDKDGKPIARPDMEAAANELVMRQNPNWSQLPQRERAQLQSDAFDHISLVGNLRDHQNNSIWQSIGLKDADVRADHLPDLKGARVEETGFIEGKVTPNASSGDYKITTRDGKTMYLGRDKVTEDQLSYLKRNGAKFGNQ